MDLSDDTGTISPTTSVAFSAGTLTESVDITQAQSGVQITATSGSVTGISNSFTVNVGNIDHILVRDAPDNGGSEVAAVGLTADQTLTLYAAGYDAQDNYLGDVSVTWSSPSGNLAPSVSGTGSSFTFSPTTAPTSGIIRATHATAGTDDTGTITVNVGAINFVRVNSGSSGNTAAVGAQSLSASQTLTVHASGYDSDQNYRSDESVSWSVTGGIGTLSTPSGISTTLTATKKSLSLLH